MKKNKIDRFLGWIEKGGNLLPHPATLFALFAVAVVILSYFTSLADLTVVHPGTGTTVKPFNLLSLAGLHMMLSNMVRNFTGFAPLGTVLVSLLGIGVAEKTGFIGTSLKLLVNSAPKSMLTFVIVFSGVLSNMASEVGYVLLVPLGAIIFLSVGRHPLAGLAAAFAGVSGGYSANLLLGTVDPLLSGLSQEAARIISPLYEVSPASNYYFMFVSTFIIAIVGTWITEKIVVPRLGKYEGTAKTDKITSLTRLEKRGLLFAGIVILVFAGIILSGLLPEHGFLRNPETGSVLHSPFMKGIVAMIFILATLSGIAYGIGAKTIKGDNDVIDGMGETMSTLGTYIVLVFFASQFVAYFKWTNLGLIFAIKGAMGLQALGISGLLLMLAFIVLSGFINMFMGSASAKWAIMAPVFIPMFMLLGYTPELTQVAYRIGDSVTNIISPMMSYFALIVAYVARYHKKAGIGTVVSIMLPYSLAFFVVWSIMFVIWFLLKLPVGPGAGLFLN